MTMKKEVSATRSTKNPGRDTQVRRQKLVSDFLRNYTLISTQNLCTCGHWAQPPLNIPGTVYANVNCKCALGTWFPSL
jgi:hypothetical protein